MANREHVRRHPLGRRVDADRLDQIVEQRRLVGDQAVAQAVEIAGTVEAPIHPNQPTQEAHLGYKSVVILPQLEIVIMVLDVIFHTLLKITHRLWFLIKRQLFPTNQTLIVEVIIIIIIIIAKEKLRNIIKYQVYQYGRMIPT